jgi:hypothetical protein
MPVPKHRWDSTTPKRNWITSALIQVGLQNAKKESRDDEADNADRATTDFRWFYLALAQLAGAEAAEMDDSVHYRLVDTIAVPTSSHYRRAPRLR